MSCTCRPTYVFVYITRTDQTWLMSRKIKRYLFMTVLFNHHSRAPYKTEDPHHLNQPFG